MNKHISASVAAVMTAAIALAAVPLSAPAADRAKNVVVIGDSISLGASLGSGEKSYVEQLKDTGSSVQLFAAEDATTTTVLADLDSNASLKSALSSADVIIVNIGMHDVMDPFIAQVEEYKQELGFTSLSELFTAKMEDYGFTNTDQLIPYSNALGRAARSNKAAIKENIPAIGDKLAEYTAADVIFINQYNCMNTLENYSSLSANRQTAYDTVSNPINLVVRDTINASITTTAEAHGFKVVDTFDKFAGLAWQYSYPVELDPNMTALGHNYVASAVMEAADLTAVTTTTTTTTTTPATTTTTTTSATTTTTTTTEATSTTFADFPPTVEYDNSVMKVGETRAFRFYNPETHETGSDASVTVTSGNATVSYTKGSDTAYVTATAPGTITLQFSGVPGCAFIGHVSIKAQLVGDVSGDDTVNAVDASMVLVYTSLAGLPGVEVNLNAEQLAVADYNGDGSVNAVDASEILIYAANSGLAS